MKYFFIFKNAFKKNFLKKLMLKLAKIKLFFNLRNKAALKKSAPFVTKGALFVKVDIL